MSCACWSVVLDLDIDIWPCCGKCSETFNHQLLGLYQAWINNNQSKPHSHFPAIGRISVVWAMPQHLSSSADKSSVTVTGTVWRPCIPLTMIVWWVTLKGIIFDRLGSITGRTSDSLHRSSYNPYRSCIGEHCSLYIGQQWANVWSNINRWSADICCPPLCPRWPSDSTDTGRC
jgi:hypothetical protein